MNQVRDLHLMVGAHCGRRAMIMTVYNIDWAYIQPTSWATLSIDCTNSMQFNAYCLTSLMPADGAVLLTTITRCFIIVYSLLGTAIDCLI